MKQLHNKVKAIYETLEQTIKIPFNKEERQIIYVALLKKITAISKASYSSDDAKRVQYRITRQNKNLLTALIHESVPLTNNLAERAIRPLVVTRKISGGSRSVDGAQIHAINMSVIQTMKMKNEPLINTLYTNLVTKC